MPVWGHLNFSHPFKIEKKKKFLSHLTDNRVAEQAPVVSPTILTRFGVKYSLVAKTRIRVQEPPLRGHETPALLRLSVRVRRDGDPQELIGSQISHGAVAVTSGIGGDANLAVMLRDAGCEVLQEVLTGQHQERDGQEGDHHRLKTAHSSYIVQNVSKSHGVAERRWRRFCEIYNLAVWQSRWSPSNIFCSLAVSVLQVFCCFPNKYPVGTTLWDEAHPALYQTSAGLVKMLLQGKFPPQRPG